MDESVDIPCNEKDEDLMLGSLSFENFWSVPPKLSVHKVLAELIRIWRNSLPLDEVEIFLIVGKKQKYEQTAIIIYVDGKLISDDFYVGILI